MDSLAFCIFAAVDKTVTVGEYSIGYHIFKEVMRDE